jgi:hypothetical protein
MAAWYVSSVGWTAVTPWAALTSYSVGDLRRQLAAPSVGNERVWRCTTAGVSGAAEPTWTLTKGSTTNDGTAVWTEVTGSSTYNSASSYAAPHARTVNAIAWGAAGDDYYFPASHAETRANTLTITFNGTSTAPDRALCVDSSGVLTTGASITVTGNFALTLAGVVYGYGITFNCGTGSSASANLNISNANGSIQTWEACAFNLITTSGSAGIVTGGGSASSLATLVNCTLSFGATGQSLKLGSSKTTIASKPGSVFVTGATVPTTLVSTQNAGAALVMSGLDLSASGSGVTLFGASSLAVANIVNCKLNASVTVAATPTNALFIGPDLIGCNSTTNVERNERYRYQGTLTTELTIIRTAGASDGTTAYSWKIVTTANSKRTFPFETFEGAIWNDAIGSPLTLTVHTVTDNVTLTDAEIWVEVEYLGSSATPVATLITDANATVLTTPANQTSDSGTAWTTTDLGTPVKQQLNVTFTPQMKGPVRFRVKVAKASTTVYVDPKADLA